MSDIARSKRIAGIAMSRFGTGLTLGFAGVGRCPVRFGNGQPRHAKENRAFSHVVLFGKKNGQMGLTWYTVSGL